MSELLEGWATVRLEDLIVDRRVGLDRARSDQSDHDSAHRYIRMQNIDTFGRLNSDALTLVNATRDEAETYCVQEGDLLFCTRNSRELVGKTALVSRAESGCLFNNNLMRIRMRAEIDPRFANYQMAGPTFRASLEAVKRATTSVAAVYAKDLVGIELAVCSVSEQKRIVTAIEEAVSKLDAGEAGLRIVRQKLKRMREAILNGAVTGKLVPQNPSDTSAVKLLANLNIEPLEDESLDQIPNSWVWVQLGHVAAMSLGKMLDSKQQTGEFPVEYLRNVNVRWFSFDTVDLATMDISPDELERISLLSGDLVVCEGGEPGRCAVWTGPPVAIQKALHRVRLSGAVVSDYAALVLRWWTRRDGFDQFITGTTIKHIPKEKLRLLPIPVPPTEEQQRIVAEVQRQFSFLDACDRAVEVGLARSAALRRSVLKAAFEGKLVPQDPSDEPASELVDRIRAERAAAQPSKRVTARRKKVESS